MMEMGLLLYLGITLTGTFVMGAWLFGSTYFGGEHKLQVRENALRCKESVERGARKERKKRGEVLY